MTGACAKRRQESIPNIIQALQQQTATVLPIDSQAGEALNSPSQMRINGCRCGRQLKKSFCRFRNHGSIDGAEFA
eukprot:CAMPEP_0179024424 /NCGR_PEP_ID=MMETSP0796-20121207/7446_1 /TAXON_ID=73915 /ORGANISM="Pyrodinium bahamense, Strain pbaha01" /LENGTH=74 /DNA_ID=CAMNT_0020720381 /DNA_START=14 /DNA_END=235 /DNA_ORIENTATION=+